MAYDDGPMLARGPHFAKYKRPTKRRDEAALARQYATSRLKQLSAAGLGDLIPLGEQGMTADPAAQWRAASASMMQRHAAAAPEGAAADPRVWLQQLIEQNRQRNALKQAAASGNEDDARARMLATMQNQVGPIDLGAIPIPEAAQRRAVAAAPRAAVQRQGNPLAALRGMVKRVPARRAMRRSGLRA